MDQPNLKPIPGAFGFRCSNPPVLCIAALLASVEIFEEAKLPRLRNKSLLLTTYLEQLLLTEFGSSDAVRIITPSDPHHRGCQLSLLFQNDVAPLNEKLMAKGVLCDVRKPNVIRVSPTPLYNRFEDVLQFVKILKTIV
jgi:kynureninase